MTAKSLSVVCGDPNHNAVCPPPALSLVVRQASQLGVYRAFVDNYELAVETAEKCGQANTQFAEISEVRC